MGDRRLAGLDGLRALACLAVFGVHFQQMTEVSGKWGYFDLERLLLNGNTGVALFFLMSGYLLALSLWQSPGKSGVDETLRGYASRRLFRILPAYYVCLTFLAFVQSAWSSPGKLIDFASHYLFVHSLTDDTFYSISSPFWTLSIQMQFYLLFAALTWTTARIFRNSTGAILAVYALVAVSSYAIHLWVCQSAGVWLSELTAGAVSPEGRAITRSILAHLPIFFLGACSGVFQAPLANWAARTNRRWPMDLLLWTLSIAVITVLSTPLDDRLLLPNGRYNLPYIPVALVLTTLAAPHSRTGQTVLMAPPLRLLGKISYGFYVYHLTCLNVVEKFCETVGLTGYAWVMALLVGGLSTSVLVSVVSYSWLEQPLMRLMRKRVPPRRLSKD